MIVVAAYGEGADALVFRATEALATARPRSIADGLARGVPLPSYEKYLKSRNVLPVDYQGEPTPRVDVQSVPGSVERELALHDGILGPALLDA